MTNAKIPATTDLSQEGVAATEFGAATGTETGHVSVVLNPLNPKWARGYAQSLAHLDGVRGVSFKDGKIYAVIPNALMPYMEGFPFRSVERTPVSFRPV